MKPTRDLDSMRSLRGSLGLVLLLVALGCPASGNLQTVPGAHSARLEAPTLTVLSPTPESKAKGATVNLAFKVKSASDQRVTGVRVLVDGRPASISGPNTSDGQAQVFEGTITGTFLDDKEYTYQVAVPDRDVTLLVLADSRSVTSEPTILKLQRADPPFHPQEVVPPTITLLSPPTETVLQAPVVDLVVRVKSLADQPVKRIKVLLNGVPVPIQGVLSSSGKPLGSATNSLDGESYRFQIRVPERESTVIVLAETAFATSDPAVAKLHWKSQQALLSPAPTRPSDSPAALNPSREGGISASEDELVKRGEIPSTKKLEGKTDSGATRILEGNGQAAPLPLEVDSKGRLRWQHHAPEVSAMPKVRGVANNVSPTVQIISPTDGSQFREKEIQLSVKVGSPAGQEISKVQVFIDGVPTDAVPLTSGGTPVKFPLSNGQVLKYRLTLPLQNCQIMVSNETTSSQSRPQTIRLRYGTKVATSLPTRATTSMAKPKIAIIDPPMNSGIKGNTVQIGVRVSVEPGQPSPAIRILVDAQETKVDRAPNPKSSTPPSAPNANLSSNSKPSLSTNSKPGPPAPKSNTPQAVKPDVNSGGDRGGQEEIQYFTVNVPNKDCTVMAYAETPYATSDPSLIKLRWDMPGMATPATGLPTLYLLAVGVSKYKDKSYALTYPAKDARDFAEAMKLQKGKLYKDVISRVHTDEAATRDNVMDDLEWIQKQATQRDMVIVFFAGHGINDTVTGNYYYLPFDANMEAVKRTMIPGSEIHSTLSRLTGTRLLFIDTCHAGNITGASSRGIPDMRQFLQDLKDGGQGLVVITSSRPGQKSQEHPSWNNGAFTKALVEGLKGKAQHDKQGFVTFTSLDAYITQRVKELTGGTQAPTTQKGTEVSDFPVAFVEN